MAARQFTKPRRGSSASVSSHSSPRRTPPSRLPYERLIEAERLRLLQAASLLEALIFTLTYANDSAPQLCMDGGDFANIAQLARALVVQAAESLDSVRLKEAHAA